LYNTISNYHKKIESLQEIIINDSDRILDMVDLTVLIKYPQAYLRSIAKQFHNAHMDQIQAGTKAGEQFANKMI